jgi:hypothetical protein
LSRLGDEELHNLYASSNVIRVTKSRRMEWPVHLTHMRMVGNAYSILVGRPEGVDNLEDLGVNSRNIL